MNSFFKYTFFCFLFCSSIESQAQDAPTENPNIKFDKKYTPNQNSIFNLSGKKNKSNSSGDYSREDITVKQIIKFCPTALFRSKVLFYYDIAIAKGLVGSVGIGKAFGFDFFQKTFLEFNLSETSNEGASLNALFDNSTYLKSNLYLSGGLKFYVDGNSYDGDFIQFKYSREKLTLQMNSKINANYIEGDKECIFAMNAFSFGYGYTFMSGQKRNFSHEFFIGTGVKFFTYSNYILVKNANNPLAPNDSYVRSPTNLKTRILPSLTMSYAFGFGF
jgi:hypothetical protein